MVANVSQVDAIFSVAIEIASAEEREHYVSKACGEDAALRQRVEALLASHSAAGSFLEQPALAGDATVLQMPAVTEGPGTVIGLYKLLQQIGEGGMGVVFMAEQSDPIQRTVALKIIKPGMDTRQVIARFEAERQALAMMDHPNIARVIDAGATDSGRPYFVMDLVKGVPITEYCDQQQLPIRQRLELMTEVCHAVQHAHQKGIIHRDLKPSNVLVAEYDGKPVPRIIDFGVAKATAQKLTEKTLFTEYGQLVGTFEYMSPEQARFNQLEVDTRSDIYSLGVLLYELLAGSTPIEKERLRTAAFEEILRMIGEEEPPRPSTRLSSSQLLPSISARRQIEPGKLKKLVAGELDWIVMTCLEKDRHRRYETASGLASDLSNYLSDEPVLARPSTVSYRFKKLVRRNKASVLAGTVIAAALIVGTVLSTWLYLGEKSARHQAVTEANKSQQVTQFLRDMLRGVLETPVAGRDTSLLREIVDKSASRIANELKDQPEVQAELFDIVGGVYFKTGPMDKAESMKREALKIRRKIFGDDSEEVFESLHNLGVVLWRQGNLTEAEDLTRQAVQIQRKLGWLANPDHAVSLLTLNGILREQGKLAESEAVAREAVQVMKELHGESGPSFRLALTYLGDVLQAEDKLDEAESTLREAVAVARKHTDPQAPAGALNALGNVLQRSGKEAEAETVMREAIELRRQRSDQQRDPYLAWYLDSLAGLLDSQDRSGEAEELLRESWTIKRKVFGDRHAKTEPTLDWLIEVLKSQGKTAEAETLRHESAEAAELLGITESQSSTDKQSPDDTPIIND
jgi:eukaryotic-like serine/threonine-protein kinase